MREVYVSRKGLLIGRSGSNDVDIQDVHVSRRHAFIIPLHGELVIYDLDSTNGTYWCEPNNNVASWIKVNEVALVRSGAEVLIGDTIFVLRIA